MQIFKWILLVPLILGGAAVRAEEPVRARVYSFHQEKTKQTQIYLVATRGDQGQLFQCAKPTASATPSLDGFVKSSCRALFGDTKKPQLSSSILKGRNLSFHLGDSYNPEVGVLSLLGNAKSWIAVFSLDLEDDAALLFTGAGIEVGEGLPRTDSVRITLNKINDGELREAIPLVALKTR